MAFAAVSRARKGKKTEGVSSETEEQGVPSYLSEFPDESLRIKDLQLAVLLGRTWQMRRIVYTKDVIVFSRVGEDVILDAVPMSEVVGLDHLKSQDNDDGSVNTFEATVDFSHAFQIRTRKDGFNAGRKYFIQATSDEMVTDLMAEISKISKAVAKRLAAESEWKVIQKRVRKIYNSSLFQGSAAFLIVANFFTSVIEAQQQDSLLAADGSPTFLKVVLDNLNMGFTAIFTAELLTNMCANWFSEFASNSWSVFDALVVLISLVALGPLDFPVSILRALRVVRLFGRLEASKKILAALSVSLVPMCNAFFIMLIVAMIYSIMGVALFRDTAPRSFGLFDRALSSMFRLTAGETWLDELVLLDTESGYVNYGALFFVNSYIVVVVWILLQVSVAVLLDNFVSHTMKAEEEANLERINERKSKSDVTHPLEPLIMSLIKGYIDNQDMSEKIIALYKVMDTSGDGSLSCTEFCTSIKRLDARIHMSESDFVNITRNGELCNAEGEIGVREFETIMRKEVTSYLQTRLTDFSNFRTGEDIEFTHLGALKTILSEVLIMAEEQRKSSRDIRELLGERMGGSSIDGDQKKTRSKDSMVYIVNTSKALLGGMEALVAELADIKAVIRDHATGFGQLQTSTSSTDLLLVQPGILPAKSSCSVSSHGSNGPDVPSKNLKSKDLHSTYNAETALTSAEQPARETSKGLGARHSSAVQGKSKRRIRSEQKQVSGQNGQASNSIFVRSSGIDTGNSAIQNAYNECIPFVPGKDLGVQRRSFNRASASAASASAKLSNAPRAAKHVNTMPENHDAQTAASEELSMLKKMATSIESDIEDSEIHTAPFDAFDRTLFGQASGFATVTSSPTARSQKSNFQGYPGLGIDLPDLEVEGPMARATSNSCKMEGEVVLVQSNRYFRQNGPRFSLLPDPDPS